MAECWQIVVPEPFPASALALLDERFDVRVGRSGAAYGEDELIALAGQADALAIYSRDRISARVLDMFCWKPIDQKAIVKAAMETGAIVTAENHNVLNGLGAAVSEVLVKNRPVPVEMIGVQDEFGEVGPLDYLAERFKLNAVYIVEAAKKAIARKA